MEFKLDEFIRSYVSAALEVAKSGHEFDKFFDTIEERVTKDTGFPRDFVRHIHHSFHWTFFCDRETIVQKVESRKKGQNDSIRLRREYTEKDIDELTKEIIAKQGPYVLERARRYHQQA